ncbi:phage integrase central domain-containing protein [Methylibium sp. Root1272]|uniref:tyrosine-type recombinase/integrase n=1 Tax=Methylibium sp. Root1272 TaxID=1736441 RepID=UPI0006F8313A|nr:tyrosine-type recombinase/integrase [Methylibium sp. Root1272]KQW69904.1 integrase [Methylibium sp. Root1272]
MAQHLIPSTASIKAVKPGDPRSRLTDGAGLYLRLFVKGGSHGWRFDYSLNGRRNTLSLGTFPDVGLALARKKAEEARKLVSAGGDPSEVRKEARSEAVQRRATAARAAAGLPPENSFEAVAREWYEKNATGWAPSHASKIIRRLELDVFPWIGSRMIDTIRPTELLALLKRVEDRGAIETTHRVQQNCGQVFRYAVATGRATSDPSRDLRGALTPWKPEHYPTLTEPRQVGQLLRDIESYDGGFITKCAMRLAPMLFVRPGELRRAEWSEINLEAAEWRIPAAKMKGRVMHIVPLATQALAILEELKPLTGKSRWVFPGVRTNGEPMSENTINAALRRLGYDRTKLTAHGFRGMASTMLHECGWPSDVIERQLSHAERNAVKAAYNHAEHLPARRKMMQAWADHLDALRQGGSVVAIRA